MGGGGGCWGGSSYCWRGCSLHWGEAERRLQGIGKVDEVQEAPYSCLHSKRRACLAGQRSVS